MMPGIDGFELLRELRADPLTRTIPIILLSARAGEEARVEGLEAGADDYLTKPFAARELIARVEASLKLARVRREAAEREQALRAQAEQAARTRAEFMSVAAHELRTPLTGLRGSVQLLLSRAAQGQAITAEQTERLLRTIDTQSSKLTALIAKLLDMTRIEAGRLALDAQPHDVTSLVEEVATHARMQTARHAIVVRSPGETLALIDPLRIEQVLTNLVDNAVKYSPTGGDIFIDVETSNAHEVSIAVSDHGLGIDPEHLPHIFDRFYQVDRQSPAGGMGIGLYVSQQIVRQHGGEITVEPNPTGGSRFVVRLPAAAA
jgi:signal transduction histidine kinase